MFIESSLGLSSSSFCLLFFLVLIKSVTRYAFNESYEEIKNANELIQNK